MIDTGDAARIVKLESAYQGASAEDLVRAMVTDVFPGTVAAVSSFGAEAAVLLHMVALADRATPVIFLETGKHFPETLAYRDLLVDRLRLTDVRSIRPDAAELAARDPSGTLHQINPDACCQIRKVQPLAEGLAGFEAWFTGRKSYQNVDRADLPVFEWDGGRVKINPLARWTPDMIDTYMDDHSLPRHPLAELGYPSIGCQPCTSPVTSGERARAGRWRGRGKSECGIHRPVTRVQPVPATVPAAHADPLNPSNAITKEDPVSPTSTNVFAVDHAVNAIERADANGHRGGVLWLTGLSGAGKSTVAMALERRLFDQGWQVFTLDGDNLRHGLNGDLGFSPDDRDENIRRAAETAKLMAETGVLVIATFISPLREHRRVARDIVGWDFHEVFVDADLSVCEARDPKGLYVRARAGEIPEFTGVSAPYEAPTHPEVHLNTAEASVAGCVDGLARYAARVLAHGEPRARKAG